MATSRSASTDGAGGPTEDAKSWRKRLRPRRVPVAAALEEEVLDGVGEEAAVFGWSSLPAEPLLVVLAFLDNGSVVSAGQTCRGWRAVAKMAAAWRHRELDYFAGAPAYVPEAAHRRDAASFARIILFAPCLRSVRLRDLMKPYARKAINEKCQVRAFDLNGALKWHTECMKRMGGHLREVTLSDPNLSALLEAVKLPALQSLCVRVTNRRNFRQLPAVVPAGTEHTDTVERLDFSGRVSHAVVASLLSLFAASLRDLKLDRFQYHPPPAGLESCVALRRLHVPVHLSPDGQQRLRALLESVKKPLEQLVISQGFRHESAHECTTFRQALRNDGLVKDVNCKVCKS